MQERIKVSDRVPIVRGHDLVDPDQYSDIEAGVVVPGGQVSIGLEMPEPASEPDF